METVKAKKRALTVAAARLKISYRQAVRISKARRAVGDAALIHGLDGKAPWHRFGEPAQFGGSRHDWFEGRTARCRLITIIDGAAKTRLPQFFEEETAAVSMEALPLRIKRYGIPQNLYCGRKNAFVPDREPADAELDN